ncbi:MAG: class A beta-lactamase-related serine hydrolase [Spirochaetales bacterium]|nr:MAG: class A beta-lactamase-related serine hydrolase [Spirochaetales bacterium]
MKYLFAFGLIMVFLNGCSLTEQQKLNYDSGQVYPANTLPAALADKYQAMLDKCTANGMPGITFLIDSPAGFWAGASGYADVESQSLVSKTSRMKIGSCTKIYMAVLFIKMAEAGLIGMNDMISNYLEPEILDNIANTRDATILQLLNHTSGIPDYLHDILAGPFDIFNNMTGGGTIREKLKLIYGIPATSVSGTQYSYSNSGYLLLGLIAEKIYAAPIHIILQNEIFQPLGLNFTTFDSVGADPAGLTKGYFSYYLDKTIYDISDLHFYTPDGAIIATTFDVLTFIKSIFTPTFITPTQFNDMTSSGILTESPTEPEVSSLYGMGVVETTENGRIYLHHTGGTFGFTYIYCYFPVENTYIVLGVNN